MTRVALSFEQMQEVVQEQGACLAWGGSVSLSPTDDLIIRVERALDLDSEGQLVASVISKKVAAGSRQVLIDIPVGPTAKVRSQSTAQTLKRLLEKTGQALGLDVRTIITDGSQPVGRGIGPALEARDLVAFIGLVTIALMRTVFQPRRMRWTALVSHIERTGLDAMPIVGLLGFLIGVVLAYQGADQLRQFGAEIFTVNLVGVGVLREMGIPLTAIIVAGRSGSAFTAEIGSMTLNEEVDAIRTLGLDPVDMLVMPRMLALMITLPLLTFFADMMGIFGGAVMALLALDISFSQYFRQLGTAITLTTFLVGMVKAPIFAAMIAVIGCFQGLRVGRSAAAVGRATTASVVEGVFVVILLDALFSVLFSILGV